jgi:hypothetical protein
MTYCMNRRAVANYTYPNLIVSYSYDCAQNMGLLAQCIVTTSPTGIQTSLSSTYAVRCMQTQFLVCAENQQALSTCLSEFSGDSGITIYAYNYVPPQTISGLVFLAVPLALLIVVVSCVYRFKVQNKEYAAEVAQHQQQQTAPGVVIAGKKFEMADGRGEGFGGRLDPTELEMITGAAASPKREEKKAVVPLDAVMFTDEPENVVTGEVIRLEGADEEARRNEMV